jgi:hypothetical protein
MKSRFSLSFLFATALFYKMKLIIHSIAFLYMTLPVLTSMAQGELASECSAAKLIQLPGTWKAGPQGSVVNVTAADLTREKSVLASVHKMISENYSPLGCEISYSTAFSKYPSAGQTFIADPYRYAMYIYDISAIGTALISRNIMWMSPLRRQ